MLGTYESRKGHEFLLDSFVEVVKHIPSARLIICGFGYPAEVERVREAVKSRDLGHNALLEGFREDVPCLIAASMVVVVPSQSNESFGLTIVEAMSHGVPVIATAIGGIPEILVNGRGGYLVAPNDVLGMAELIKQLLSNRALREEQGRYGKQCFEENFRAEKMARKYAKLLRPSSTNI